MLHLNYFNYANTPTMLFKSFVVLENFAGEDETQLSQRCIDFLADRLLGLQVKLET